MKATTNIDTQASFGIDSNAVTAGAQGQTGANPRASFGRRPGGTAST